MRILATRALQYPLDGIEVLPEVFAGTPTRVCGEAPARREARQEATTTDSID
ncbi:MAG: hypothetical protein ACYCW6_29015 [Candidatus Xenobia bacterium]